MEREESLSEEVMNKMKTLEQQLYQIGLLFLIIGSIGVFIYFQWVLPNVKMPPCIIYTYFGFYCPGCGGTRAISALLEGNIFLSLWYHPLVLYTLVIFGGFMLTQTLERLHVGKIKGWKFHGWHMYGALIVMTGNFIIKNLLLYFFNYRM